jgi:hypothetical protein
MKMDSPINVDMILQEVQEGTKYDIFIDSKDENLSTAKLIALAIVFMQSFCAQLIHKNNQAIYADLTARGVLTEHDS